MDTPKLPVALSDLDLETVAGGKSLLGSIFLAPPLTSLGNELGGKLGADLGRQLVGGGGGGG